MPRSSNNLDQTTREVVDTTESRRDEVKSRESAKISNNSDATRANENVRGKRDGEKDRAS